MSKKNRLKDSIINYKKKLNKQNKSITKRLSISFTEELYLEQWNSHILHKNILPYLFKN